MSERESTENPILGELDEVLSQLSIDQLRFVVARLQYPTDKSAAEAVGISKDTVYRWPEIVKEAVRLMAVDGLVAATHIRRRNLAKAMMVKADGLDSDSEGIKQKVATEIIEWEMGRAVQPVDGVSVNVYIPDNKRDGD